MLNVPGNGSKPCFMDDPFFRLQKWGANLMTNPINLESDLMGLSRSLNRDCIGEDEYQRNAAQAKKVVYPTCLPTTEQPRATNPAWTARDLEQVDWWTLHLDPQEHVCIPFQNNLSTRILEKDYFVAQAPCLPKNTPPELPSRPFGGTGRAPGGLCTAVDSCSGLAAAGQ